MHLNTGGDAEEEAELHNLECQGPRNLKNRGETGKLKHLGPNSHIFTFLVGKIKVI